mgnify:FL=1
MVEKRGIKMANSKWVRDNHKLKGEALRTYLEEYAKKHFLKKEVRDVRIKLRGAYIYIFTTVFNDYQTHETGKEVWDEIEIARLGWIGGDDYSLAYFRHTGKWQDCLSGTLDQCLQAIKDNEFGLFWIF